MALTSKQDLAKCFQDTLRFIEENQELKAATMDSEARTRVYPVDFAEEVDVKKEGRVVVFRGRTLRETITLHAVWPSKRIAVLNFAASGTPGGGAYGGAHAQEESICRSSTLYPTLITQAASEGFYEYHHKNCGWASSDTCIYSPDVVVCKDDSDGIPQRLLPEEFFKVDVITCAAPHIFRNIQISDEDLFAMHLSRAKNIMRSAVHNGVDILITGAFGCGAFKNPPKVVAGAWREALKDYREKFDITAFVIYVSDYPPKRPEGENSLHTFREVFAE